MRERTQVIGEVGDLSAPPGTRDWAVAVRLDIQATLNDERGDAAHIRVMTDLLREHKGYKKLVNRKGCPFASYESFCVEPQPFGLGYKKEDIERIVAERNERKSPEARAENAKPIREHRRPTSEELLNKVDIINFKTRGGTSSDYLSSKIARDRPDILDRMKAGEFPSVRAAAKAAGLVKPMIQCVAEPAFLARQVRAKFTPDQVAELIRLLQEAVGGGT